MTRHAEIKAAEILGELRRSREIPSIQPANGITSYRRPSGSSPGEERWALVPTRSPRVSRTRSRFGRLGKNPRHGQCRDHRLGLVLPRPARKWEHQFWGFVKSCRRISPQNKGEMPVVCIGRCSDFARESEMILPRNGRRRGARRRHVARGRLFRHDDVHPDV
jgi:hypothetical protein